MNEPAAAWLHILTVATGVATVLVGGIFFAFSNFVMKALSRVPPTSAIPAMQSINVVVLNAGFLAVFLGTALSCGVLAVASITSWRPGFSAWVLLGSILYIAGTFGVTLACNVPRNDALARIDAAAPNADAIWARYVREWTRWNHVRTVAALGAGTAFLIASRG